MANQNTDSASKRLSSGSQRSKTNVSLESPSQRPNTPVKKATVASSAASMTPIPADFFYQNEKTASSKNTSPPSLPPRPKGAGSTTTKFAMTTPPPDYREPVLVSEEPVTASNVEPVSAANAENKWWPADQPEQFSNSWSQEQASGPAWDAAWGENTGTSGWTSNLVSASWGAQSVPIANRDLDEELSWWSPESRLKHKRPGPGMLPPILQEQLHDGNHTLYSVKASPPDWVGSLPPSTSTTESRQTSTLSYDREKAEEEVRLSVPHPNAYFCPKENAWIILAWKSSSVIPPLSDSFEQSKHPLPDKNARKSSLNCLHTEGHALGEENKTHHFHHYSNAVDSLKLTPPYRPTDWSNPPSEPTESPMLVDSEKSNQTVELPMDLFICCQCSFYCVGSPPISGVIPAKLWESYIKERGASPQPGANENQAVFQAVEGLSRYC
jgi:ubiquitin carboxyl-terminal hydrolase 25